MMKPPDPASDPAAAGGAEPRSGNTTVFLERRSYRRRRLTDAAKLFPVLGAVLFLVPLLWQPGAEETAIPMSRVFAYVFTAWAVLIGINALFWLGVSRWVDGWGSGDNGRSGHVGDVDTET